MSRACPSSTSTSSRRSGTAPQVVRFLSFKNDKEHKLGQTPIPDGNLKVYRSVDDQKHLSYEGQSAFKYIPVDEEVELNLGAVADVVVEPKLMDYKTENYRFDNKGNVNGWDEVRVFSVEVRNTRDVPVKIEIRRNFRRAAVGPQARPATRPATRRSIWTRSSSRSRCRRSRRRRSSTR